MHYSTCLNLNIKMNVKMNKLNIVGNWNWDLGDNENCTICMTPYECPCPNCKIPGDDCRPIEGNCNHFFHLHCIYKWLESGNDKCPLDREPWAEKIVSVVNNTNNANNNNNDVSM